MHNRQSGAAHVPIMFFLILLVMFLGALGFAFVQQSDNTKLLNERQEARNDLATLQKRDLLIRHYIEDIGKVFGKYGTYEGREGQASVYQGATIADYTGLMNPKELQGVLDSGAGSAGIAKAGSLEALLGAMVAKMNSLTDRANQAEMARDKAMADKGAVEASLAETGRNAARTTGDLSQNFEQARTDFDAQSLQKQSNIEQLTDSLRNKNDELISTKEAALAKEKQLLGRIGILQSQLSAMTELVAQIKPPEVADGRILVAKAGVPTAFINLGRKDLLQPGTVFRVTGRTSSAVKGYCEVTAVEDERAEVRLYDFVDPIGDYAGAGDLLYNDLYTPRIGRTIFLLGRFSAPYSKEHLSNLLRRLGNNVVNKMGPGVDLVILGNDPISEDGDSFTSVQESDEFKLANELRVEFTYLPKIYDLIKL